LGWGVLTDSLNQLFPVWIADLISQFSFTTHFDAIRRGVIDFRDVIYFCSIIGIMLVLNVRILTTRESR
jgi:ABC-2 type transport system permease protein